VKVRRLLGVYSYRGHQTVVLAYLTEYLAGELAPGDETLEARIFPPEEIPWTRIAFQSTREALGDYLRLKE
jgi:8-oxo-dGTP diphosphatase